MIVRLSGGLGNQMFQYAMGRAVSIQRGEQLYLDTTAFYRDSQREYALEDYPLQAQMVTLSAKLYYNAVFYANRKLNFCHAGQTKLGLHREAEVFGYENMQSKRIRYVDGCWQNPLYFEDISQELRQELIYQGVLSERQRTCAEGIRASANAVVMHVRHGDYLKPQNQAIYEVPTIEYYRRAMDYMRGHLDQPTFYVFTDDIEWCRQHFFQMSDVVLPQESDCNSAQVDLYLMSQCRHFIIANSSYSWWAAWLGSREGTIKIAPQKWFKRCIGNETVLLEDFCVI